MSTTERLADFHRVLQAQGVAWDALPIPTDSVPGLSDTHRRALQLRREGRTYAAIAAELGLSSSAAYVRVSTASGKVRRYLFGEWLAGRWPVKREEGETMSEHEQVEGWAVIDLMGHSRVAGQIRAWTFAGAPFVRIDVPADGDYPGETLYQSPGSVYSVRPCTEAVARLVAKSSRPPQITRWDLPADLRRLLVEPRESYEPDDDADDEPLEDDDRELTDPEDLPFE